MLRSVLSKVVVGLVFVSGAGMAAAVPAGAASAAHSSAPSVVRFGPCATACLQYSPLGLVAHGEILRVAAQQLGTEGVTPGTTVAVVECNANLAGGDANACDQNPADLGKRGGPALTETTSTHGVGAVVKAYKVRVSSNNQVGDGFCAPGGNGGAPCFLILADVSTQAVLAEVPFSTS